MKTRPRTVLGLVLLNETRPRTKLVQGLSLDWFYLITFNYILFDFYLYMYIIIILPRWRFFNRNVKTTGLWQFKKQQPKIFFLEKKIFNNIKYKVS